MGLGKQSLPLPLYRELHLVMHLSAEQNQIASLISQRVEELTRTGFDDVRIFAEIADYMPGFKRLLDTSTRGEMDALCQQ
jgi:hypothetical protein